MPNGPTNSLVPSLEDILSKSNARLYQRERKRVATTPGVPDLDGQQAIGFLDDGHTYAYDSQLGSQRPSAPQLVPFSWPGLVVTGDPSGPHLVLLPNLSKIYAVTLAIGTVDPDADITVDFILNGTTWVTLTLPSSDSSVFELNPGPDVWPSVGMNNTDLIQVQCTAAGSIGADLVACVRIV